MHHEHRVPHYPDHGALARALADLRYDELADFIEQMACAIGKDSVLDHARGRHRLGERLAAASDALRLTGRAIDDAWRICAPHMPSEASSAAADTENDTP